MRKSFTRLFSLFVLLCGLSLQMALGAPGLTFVGASSIPKDADANVKPTDVATKFVVAFDAVPVITDAGGTIVIYKWDASATAWALIKTIPLTKTSSNVAVVGKTLEITHGISTFTQGEIYSVSITDNALTGLSTGALASGIYDFTIGDWVAPTLSSTAAAYSPLKGATSVMANLNGAAFSLTIPFSEAVTTPATPGNKAVYVYQEDGTIVDIVKVSSLTVANGLGTANITVPLAATSIFKENTNYYIRIDEGAFVDVTTYWDGSAWKSNSISFGGLTTPSTWTFTTRDYSAPAITASISDIATTSAKLNVSLTEKGKYYYLLQATTPVDPADPATAAAVKAGGTAVTVGTENTVVPSTLGVAGSTSYEVFVVAENNEATSPNLGSTIKKLTFSTVDVTAPTIISRGKLQNSNNQTYALYMTFNESVKGGAGNLDVRLNSNDSYVKTIAASAVTSTKITTAADATKYGAAINSYVVVLDLGMTLPSKTAYYVTFPDGYIQDAVGNNFVGGGAFISPVNKTDWPLTSYDYELPVVSVAFTTPGSLASTIDITFDEAVSKQANSGVWSDVIALELTDGTPVAFTAVSTPTGTLVGETKITLTPTVALSPNTTYVVRLRPDAVKDATGNAITTEKLYSLTTGDLAPFAVTYGSSLGATTTANLLANSTIQIDFNKAVKVNTTGTTWVAATAENLASVITFKKGTTAKAFTVTYDATTFTATIVPTDALASNANDYVVTIDGSKVRDCASTPALLNTAAGYVASQTYIVKDYEAPVATVSHSGDVTNILANATPTITLTDASMATLADMNGNLLTALPVPGAPTLADHITFKQDGSNGPNLAFTASYAAGVITITPTVALATGKTYYYGIGSSVQDGNNNVTAGKFATFTMKAAAVAPTITAETYTVNGSAETAVATSLSNIVPTTGNVVNVTVTFNDNVKEFTTTTPATLTDGTTTWNVTVTNAMVSSKVLTLSFATGATLASEATCTLTLPAALVQGSSYIAGTTTFAQFAGKTITFKSKDIVAPTAIANTPALAATGIALNTPITINFSEKVVLGAGNILIKEGTTTVQTIAVNSTNVSLNTAGTTATIVKTGNLPKYNTTYTIEIPKAAFTDDISLNQLSADYSGSFTTVVNPQPGTVSLALSPADNSDQVATSPLTMTMTFDEEVVKYDPSVGTRKLWYLVKQGTGAVRATINASGDLVNAGNDVVVANNYIETASVGISGNIVSIVTGFTPVAGDRYYVLITPGAFLDKSTGTGTVANPVPGVFAGITVDTSWNFTTIDENAGTVTFAYTKRADNLVATTSDIVINFSRPIVNADGSAITDAQVANLFTLTKTAGPGTLGVKAFVGTISADKKTVTILNSSLVTLGEMTQGSSFTIATAGTIKYANGSAIAGCTDSFVTSNYGLPTVAAAIAAPVAHVLKDKATVTFTCNSNTMISTVQTAMSKLYYMIQAGTAVDPAITPAVVKTSALSQPLTGTATLTKTYPFTGLAEETSYVVYAVVEDAAANLSTVATTIFITDDVTKPTLSVKPTAFDANKKLTFTFNEAVTVVTPGNLAVRILEKATMKEVAKLDLNAVAGQPTQLITDAFTGLATSNTLVSYYVEIDKGIVNDVPVVAGDATNTFDGLFRTDCEVSSSDVTAPTLSSSTPTFPAVNVNTNFSFVLTFSEAVKKATVIPAAAFQVMQYNPTTLAYDIPYEVIDPANVVTNGTSNVTVTISRTLASTTSYQISVNTAAFTDLNGTVCTSGTATGIITTKDVVSPVVTLTPANAATAVPLASAITIDFNEVIRNLDNSVIDNYDLDSLVYFKKNGVAAAFDAAISNPTGTTSRITITPATALVADASYTFGYKAKFEDASDNAVAAGQSTFSTVTTSPAAQYLTWSPVKKTATPWSALATKGAITLNFTNNIFTYSTTASANNLPVTAAWLASTAINVYENNVLVPTANLVFTVVDNKTFTVAPKTSWSSYAVVKVEINGATLQVNEGNVTVLGTAGVVWDAASFRADDTVKPILDVNKDAAPFTDGYSPVLAAAGVASPVIAKSDVLQLYFTEDVKVGSGTVEIHRWDGVLAKTVVPVVNTTDKKLVTLGSLTDLPTNQEYYVIVNEGALVDVTNSNPFAGITAVKSWRFSLRDDAYPAISTYTPNTTNIPVTTGLTINFDRPIALGTTGYIALYKSAAGGDAVQLMRAADNTPTGPISVSGSSATVALNVLEPNTQYFVEVAGGTFASAVDASKTQATQARSVWSFTTEGTTAPTILATGYAPAQNATGVGLNEDLKITFDMPVEAGSGNIQLHSTDGSIVLNFDVKTQVTFNENVVSIALPVLAQNTQYYVIIPATAIRNRTYTPEYFAGITVPYAWKFNTVTDAVAPTVVATPATGATNQKNTFDVTLTFNETVTGVDATNVKVSKGTVAISTVTAGTVYKATITAEDKAEVVLSLANGIKDAANNALVPVNFTYTVGDNTAPTAVVTPATTGKQPKAFTVTVTFNEAVTGAETGITVTGATTAVVTKTSDAVYAVAITAADNSSIVVAIANTIKDASINANAFVGATYTYTTGDNTAPSIITVNPNGGALANAHPDNFEIYVSEAVVKGTGKLTVYKKSDNSKAMELDAANVTIAAAGTAYKVTIPLTGSLDKNTEYYVNVAEGFVADASGNKLPVVDSKTFWTFKTGDFKTGIEETENSLKVYPNPFVSVVNIDSSADLSKAIVTNLAGQTVKVVANPGNSIDLSELHSGIYFISLYDMDNVIAKTVKLVKK